jgi:D-3-phosphoglycerate dehydrogenase
MRIVVLDDIGIGAKDVELLEEKGSVLVYSGMPTDADEIVQRARDANVLISGWTKIDREILASLPDLQLLSLWATGLDNVDLVAASRHGVTVCHVPSYASNAVAEFALGLTLSVMRKIPAANRDMRRTKSADWRPFQGTELNGKTLGIIGTGVIGQRMAWLGHCIGMNLLGYDLQPCETMVRDLDMRYAPLADVFAQSDVITLHAPLTPDTEHLVDATLLNTMRKTSVVVNTARAGLIEQDDLYEALVANVIAGAGLDVIDMDRESGRGLLGLDNVVVTPHIGFYTGEALGTLTAKCVENVVRFLDGDPANVANPLPAADRHTAVGDEKE